MDDIYFKNKNKKDSGKSGDRSRERISADRTPSGKKGEIRSGKQISQKDIPTRNKSQGPDFSDESFNLKFQKTAPEYKSVEVHEMQKKRLSDEIKSSAPKAAPASRTPTGKRVSSPPSRTPKGKKKKKKSVKGIIISLAIILVVAFVGVVFAYGMNALSGIDYTEIGPNEYIDGIELASSPTVKNILFIGCDARGDLEGNRSDTVMLFSIDSANKKIKLTSFLRDSYVYIPEKGRSYKLNAAFSYGGQQMLIDTLEYNFHIKIDRYVMVDFNAFRQLVNLLGGITVKDVTEREAKYMREEVKIPSIKAGTNHMDGKSALWYCRIRYIDDDFGRTARQRKVISSIISKATKTDIFTLMNICKEVLPNVSTNIPISELMSLAVNALFRYLRYDIVQQSIPADGEWSDQWAGSQQIVALDFEANRKILKEFLYD